MSLILDAVTLLTALLYKREGLFAILSVFHDIFQGHKQDSRNIPQEGVESLQVVLGYGRAIVHMMHRFS